MKELNGLTWKEATKALRVYGHNDFKVKKDHIFFIFLSQLKSPVVLIAAIYLIISLISRRNIDSLVILLVLVFNISVSFLQAYKAKNTYQNLEKLVTSHVVALRDGAQVLIDKVTVVPNDIIFLKKGDIVCADAYVIEQNDFSVNEFIVNGIDSTVNKVANLSQKKSQKDGVVYSGSQVISGSCIAKVFAIGKQTKYGMVQKNTVQISFSDYENNLRKLSRSLQLIVIGLVIVIYTINLFNIYGYNFTASILFTLAIVLAFIPDTLSKFANLTITKSTLNLSNRNIIVRNNLALEKLGNIDLICTDMKGTLTLNKFKIDFYHSVIEKDDFFKYSYLSTVENNELLDKCIFNFLKENNVQDQSEFMLEEIPFDSIKKISARKFKDYEIIKGDPEYILSIVNNISSEEQKLIFENQTKGLRAISFAVKDSSETKYIGSYFFYEQIKLEAESVIQQAKDLNIALKLITEDSKEISAFIAQRVGLIKSFEEVIVCDNLDFENKDNLLEQVTKHTVFACSNPEQKHKILETLQTKHFIGYIGDGINDTHSMSIANVDIALNSASDIAKQQSDVILLSNDLKGVINGVRDSRITFANAEKYARIALTGNIGNVMAILLLAPFNRFFLILPAQILILFLLTSVPLFALINDNVELDKLKSPKHYSINKTVKFALIFGIISTVFDLIFFSINTNQSTSNVYDQWIILSILTQVLVIFSLRTRRGIFSTTKASKELTQLTILVLLIVFAAAVFGVQGLLHRFAPESLMFVVVVTAVYFVFTELLKVPLIRLFKL